MKKVTGRPCFQGDLCIRRVSEIPPTARKVAGTNGYHILAHSETGHHHVVLERAAQMFIDETNAFIAYLDVAEPTTLDHLRSYGTHEQWVLDPGPHKINRQREYTPEGWRRAAD